MSLALDPEWSVQPPALPGQEIGSTNASVVNEVSAYLSRIVRENNLPEKLLVVHRFMSADELETPLGRERLQACVFKLPVNGRMVSMCEMNATGLRRELNLQHLSERCRPDHSDHSTASRTA